MIGIDKKNYDCDIRYHPRKANVIADVFSKNVILSQITAW